jgi:hypothetical protein
MAILIPRSPTMLWEGFDERGSELITVSLEHLLDNEVQRASLRQRCLAANWQRQRVNST